MRQTLPLGSDKTLLPDLPGAARLSFFSDSDAGPLFAPMLPCFHASPPFRGGGSLESHGRKQGVGAKKDGGQVFASEASGSKWKHGSKIALHESKIREAEANSKII